MATIKSFELNYDQGFSTFAKTVTIQMPVTYYFLSVQTTKNNQPVLWVRIEDNTLVGEKTFRFVRENETIELDKNKNYIFIGAFTYRSFVVHIFEEK